jgi:DNA-binding LytR/AlgR family response regulator
VHRHWLVTAEHINELERESSETTLFVGDALVEAGAGLHVPVSRDRATGLRRG